MLKPMLHRLTLAAALLCAAQAQATALIRLNGVETTNPSYVTGSVSSGTATLSATAAQNGSPVVISARASGSVEGGSFLARDQSASALVDTGYTVVGLDGPTRLTFTWAMTGSRQWSSENATFGAEVGVGIFSKTGALYIHNVGWGISFVDGPAFMGDFAGTLSAPIRRGGSAGSPGDFDEVVPAGDWDGQSTVYFQTLWTLDSGWTGNLGAWSSIAMGGDVDADYSVSLMSVSRPETLVLGAQAVDADMSSFSRSQTLPGNSQPYLLLDDGSRVLITTTPNDPGTIPAPSVPALLLAGGVALAWRRRCAAPAAN